MEGGVCASQRRDQIQLDTVNGILDRVHLVDLTREDLERAATSRWGLRSADAIHLAVALRCRVDELVAHNRELLSAAKAAGLPVAAPGESKR